MSDSRVRVRFAPSPTGFLHIGGLRTALYNDLMAGHNDGDFILRVEDTDQARTVEGGIENICRSLEACGVIPNEGVWFDAKGNLTERGDYGPYIQSKRADRHRAYAEQLIEKGKAYYCFCTEERLTEVRQAQQLAGQPTMYDGHCRALPPDEAAKRVKDGEAHVIRLKLPKQGNVTVYDLIRDDVTFDWSLIDDSIIFKSDGFPTYHLAATCDDHDMEISHVFRGEEWLPSTPKHLFIYDAFGWEPPKFAHLPLLLNADRSKLSKRQGDVAVEDYLNKGYLPEALVNFVALLGWNPTGDREIYSKQELVDMFDPHKINKAGAVVNFEKLDWMNNQYLRSIPVERYLELVTPFVVDKSDDHAFSDRCLLLIRDRLVHPQDAEELTGYFFKPAYDFSVSTLTWKTQSPEDAVERLKAVRKTIADLSDEAFDSSQTLEGPIRQMIADHEWSNGEVLWPLRVALSAQDKSPSPFELLWAYGKDRALDRIDHAITHLGG